MGVLVDGQWHDLWYDTDSTGGAFKREQSKFRNWITSDGSAGPTGEGGFIAEANRYHLYVSLACPWAHRTLVFRYLKGLSNFIDISVVHPNMLEHGWTFDKDGPAEGDQLHGLSYLHQLYTRAIPNYSGRVTVPVLWDKQQQTIVSNESADIIRMFNSAFDGLTGNQLDFYPEPLREEIDQVNDLVYNSVNNGVYRAGFATTQAAYEEAVDDLFATLESLDKRLIKSPFLVGDTLTEADWRLFTTLIRFDVVYVGHFKCNRKRIADYPALFRYLARLYHMPGISDTVNFDHIKRHYYVSHKQINPTGIVPKGPDFDLALAFPEGARPRAVG